MPIQPQVTIESNTYDQSIIGKVMGTRKFDLAIQAGFTPAKYNAVAVDSDDGAFVLWDAADATHSFMGILREYNATTGVSVLVVECDDVDINALSIAKLAANNDKASAEMRTKNCLVR